MTVYVDDMFQYPMGQHLGMRMSHMIADTDDELHAMAERIGVARRWHQGDHYDIAMTKRALAVQHGAVAITLRTCALMCAVRRMTGTLAKPETVDEEFRAARAARAGTTIERLASAMGNLFDSLPEFPPALPEDELRLLAELPEWDTVLELEWEQHAAARRLERRGLIKIMREKMDPESIHRVWSAGRLPAARPHLVASPTP